MVWAHSVIGYRDLVLSAHFQERMASLDNAHFCAELGASVAGRHTYLEVNEQRNRQLWFQWLMVRAICEDDTFASDRILSNDATIPLKSYMTWMSSTTSLSMTAIILFWWERYRSEEK